MARNTVTVDLMNVEAVVKGFEQAAATIQALRDEIADRANVEADLRAQLAEAKNATWPHYWSTYCIHDLHDRCRRLCKTCGQMCVCPCHKDEQ